MSTSSSSRTPASKKARYDDSVNDIPHDVNNDNTVSTQTHVESSTTQTQAFPGIFHPSLEPSLSALKASYSTSKPFPHGRISKLLHPSSADKVLDELKNNLKATFKESDLFKFYQTKDLSSLRTNLSRDGGGSDDDDGQALPELSNLQRALHSPRWLSFVESCCSLPPGTLTGSVDMAVNVHNRGCHLLCHDDVIGTRKVSYIIYFTSSSDDPEWTEEEGGMLELYPRVPAGGEGGEGVDPSPTPSKTILPLHNSMAFFVVSPNESFHSVQEVYSDRPRTSIQGWYHAKEPPRDEGGDATLERLKSGRGAKLKGPYKPFPALSRSDSEITPEEYAFLSKWINPTYLTPEALSDVSSLFESDSSVQLRSFLLPSIASQIQSLCSSSDARDGLGRGSSSAGKYEVGIGKGWKVAGPAHMQRYLSYSSPPPPPPPGSAADEAGSLLKEITDSLLSSPACVKLLMKLTSLDVCTGTRAEVRRFRPGLDYTVAHYGVFTEKPVLDCTLCFVPGRGLGGVDPVTGEFEGDEDDMLWQSGDAGGFECYVAADEEDEGEGGDGRQPKPQDEYDEDADESLLSVTASHNTLSLCYRDYGTMRFVKYLGCEAPGSRYDIGMEYRVEDFEDGEGEGESK